MSRALTVAVLLVTLSACAGGDDPPIQVAYNIEGETLDCIDASFQEERPDPYDGARLTLCGWFCATFEGEASNEILLSFRFDEARKTWVREPVVGRQSWPRCD